MEVKLKEKRTFLTMGINVLLIDVGFQQCTVRSLYIYQFLNKKNSLNYVSCLFAVILYCMRQIAALFLLFFASR
jgi:hypothetical protein